MQQLQYPMFKLPVSVNVPFLSQYLSTFVGLTGMHFNSTVTSLNPNNLLNFDNN